MPNAPPIYRPRGARRQNKRRALPVNNRAWRSVRAQQLTREPNCRECAKRGLTTPATEVDHIDGDRDNNRESNYQSLCKSCHGRKTYGETFGRY